MLLPALHLVTDRRLVSDVGQAVTLALRNLPPGAAAVHLREKDLGGRELLTLAREVGARCRAAGQLFLVNDRLDVVLACGADGIHLPSAGVPPGEARRLLGPDRLVGVSCHGEEDVRRASEGGADFATFGPVHATPSKLAYGPPLGLGALAHAAQLGLPLVALGGVDAQNAAEARASGAHGVGMIRAWLGVPDPGTAVLAMWRAVGGGGTSPDARTRPMPHHHDRHGNPEDLDAYVARLTDPDRDAWQRPDEVVAALGVEVGQTVADIGAGPGYFTLRLAHAVGTRGRVFAVEVVVDLIRRLWRRIDEAGLGNITPLLARDADSLLPPASCDRILVVDTFHHFPDGAAYLRRLAGALKPGGIIANVDFHRRETPVGPPLEHRVAREDFLAAAEQAGLAVVEEKDFLPYQYFVLMRPR